MIEAKDLKNREAVKAAFDLWLVFFAFRIKGEGAPTQREQKKKIIFPYYIHMSKHCSFDATTYILGLGLSWGKMVP